MLEVKVENILPVTEARDSFNQLVDKVEGTDEMFVLTKNGKPIAILVGVHHLEKLTGENHEELFGTAENTPLKNSNNNEAGKTDSTVDEPVVEPTVAPIDVSQNQMPADNMAIPETPAPIAPAAPVAAPIAPTIADSSASTTPSPSPFTYDNIGNQQTAAPAAAPTNTTITPETPTQDITNTDSQTANQTPAATDTFAMPNDPFATPDTTAAPASTTATDTNTTNNSQNNPINPTPAA